MQVRQVPVDLIRPGGQQARRQFSAESLQELARSIRESGVIQPVVLRTRVGGFELLAGERRWRAAQLAQLHELPAIIRDDLDDDEAFVLGLIENLQRESLSPMEAAAGIRRLGDLFELTHEQIGLRIGKSREYVSNYLRLLQLNDAVQTLLDQGHLHLGHAKVLAALPAEQQTHWADAVIRGKLSVRQLELRLSASRRRKRSFKPEKPSDWRRLEQRLSDLLACPVTVQADGKGKGELRMRFHSLDELDGVLARIGYTGE